MVVCVHTALCWSEEPLLAKILDSRETTRLRDLAIRSDAESALAGAPSNCKALVGATGPAGVGSQLESS